MGREKGHSLSLSKPPAFARGSAKPQCSAFKLWTTTKPSIFTQLSSFCKRNHSRLWKQSGLTSIVLTACLTRQSQHFYLCCKVRILGEGLHHAPHIRGRDHVLHQLRIFRNLLQESLHLRAVKHACKGNGKRRQRKTPYKPEHCHNAPHTTKNSKVFTSSPAQRQIRLLTAMAMLCLPLSRTLQGGRDIRVPKGTL